MNLDPSRQNMLHRRNEKGKGFMKARSYVLSIWDIIDPIYYSFTRLTYVNTDRKRNIFRVRLMRYRGADVTLADGTCLQRGDFLLKIHLHNVVLLKEISPMLNNIKKGRYIYRLVENSLPGIASYIQNHPKSEQIKGIIGITILNKGCHSLGFETYSISSLCYRVFKWFTIMPIYLLSVSQPIKTFKKQSPKYLLMSKETLLARYGHQ